jgi:hypothetical protein
LSVAASKLFDIEEDGKIDFGTITEGKPPELRGRVI